MRFRGRWLYLIKWLSFVDVAIFGLEGVGHRKKQKYQ